MNRRPGSSGSVDPSVGPVVGELVQWVPRLLRWIRVVWWVRWVEWVEWFGGGSVGPSLVPVDRVGW